jgi:hypothetical protein
VDLSDDGWGRLVAFCGLLEGFNLLRRIGTIRVDALDPQRPLDGHFPIAKSCVRKDLGLLRLLELEEGIADAMDVLLGQLAVLLAEVLA